MIKRGRNPARNKNFPNKKFGNACVKNFSETFRKKIFSTRRHTRKIFRNRFCGRNPKKFKRAGIEIDAQTQSHTDARGQRRSRTASPPSAIRARAHSIALFRRQQAKFCQIGF
jgi:hypothetical protein